MATGELHTELSAVWGEGGGQRGWMRLTWSLWKLRLIIMDFRNKLERQAHSGGKMLTCALVDVHAAT